MSTKNRKTDLQYGNREFESPENWKKSETKIRITTFLDEDLLEKIKSEAAVQNKKYQTYLNERLREVFMDEESVETRLKRLEEIVKKKGL